MQSPPEVVDVKDAEMLGYAHIVANLIDYYNDDPRHARRKGPKVTCVKVASMNDRNSPDKPFLQDIKIPRSHRIFDNKKGKLSGLSKVLPPSFQKIMRPLQR